MRWSLERTGNKSAASIGVRKIISDEYNKRALFKTSLVLNPDLQKAQVLNPDLAVGA